jgi:L-fuconolactonase
MIVDAHHHLWQPERGYLWLQAPGLEILRRPFTPQDLSPELLAAGVAATVLVEGGRCHVDEAAEFLGYGADTEAIAGVVCWIDIAGHDVGATLQQYQGLRGGDLLVGVRAQAQAEDDDYLDRTDVLRGLAQVAAAGLVFDLVVRVDQLPSAARAARALPELRFVLDHLGKPHIGQGESGLRQWREPFSALAKHPNVTCKLSGMVTEAGPGWSPADLRPFVDAALDNFGPSRLMFGSDWPVCLLAASYADVLAALREALPPLSREDLDNIFARTAIRTYGLQLPGTG